MSRYEFDAPRLFVDQPMSEGAILTMDRDQANYLLNVLRLREGDKILTFNGRNGEWLASVGPGSRKSAPLMLERQTRPQEFGPDLHYLFAPLKHARLDYMVQKAAEMGVSRLSPVFTRRTQNTRINLERMRANAIEAAEQCGILCVPEVDEPVKFEQIIANWPADRLLIVCDEDAPVLDPVRALEAVKEKAAKTALLIGPEGGFDPAERKLFGQMEGALIISLGPRILRADTAAVAALALVQATLGDWRS